MVPRNRPPVSIGRDVNIRKFEIPRMKCESQVRRMHKNGVPSRTCAPTCLKRKSRMLSPSLEICLVPGDPHLILAFLFLVLVSSRLAFGSQSRTTSPPPPPPSLSLSLSLSPRPVRYNPRSFMARSRHLFCVVDDRRTVVF